MSSENKPFTVYGQDGRSAKLFHGLAEVVTPLVGNVDVVFTDPPYLQKMGAGGGYFEGRDTKIHGESLENICNDYDRPLFFQQWLDAGAKHIWVWCSREQIAPTILEMEKHKLSWDIFVWRKRNAPPRVFNTWWCGEFEFALHGRTAGAYFNNSLPYKEYKTRFMDGQLLGAAEYNGDPSNGSMLHPTAKPVPFVKRYLSVICRDGDTVLDPFMGGGSHGVACMEHQIKLNYIGIERCPTSEEPFQYFELAKRRISAAASQRVLQFRG